ncbi:MAG: gamma-glutamyltransferase, partial [Chitinophagaceae bacterium]
MNKNFLLLALLYFLSACNNSEQKREPSSVSSYKYTIQKESMAKNGAVVSSHALASTAGVKILVKGGNAIDAAIATQLALAVVYPGAGNLGGGGFMVAHLKSGENVT